MISDTFESTWPGENLNDAQELCDMQWLGHYELLRTDMEDIQPTRHSSRTPHLYWYTAVFQSVASSCLHSLALFVDWALLSDLETDLSKNILQDGIVPKIEGLQEELLMRKLKHI